MTTVTRKELIERVADGSSVQRAQVRKVVKHFLEHVMDDLAAGHRIEFRGFGVFDVRSRAARTAQNPKTLQRVTVPAKRTVKFKPGRELRDRLESSKPLSVQVPSRRAVAV